MLKPPEPERSAWPQLHNVVDGLTVVWHISWWSPSCRSCSPAAEHLGQLLWWEGRTESAR